MRQTPSPMEEIRGLVTDLRAEAVKYGQHIESAAATQYDRESLDQTEKELIAACRALVLQRNQAMMLVAEATKVLHGRLEYPHPSTERPFNRYTLASAIEALQKGEPIS